MHEAILGQSGVQRPVCLKLHEHLSKACGLQAQSRVAAVLLHRAAQGSGKDSSRMRIGIAGNEAADELAGVAAETHSSNCDQVASVDLRASMIYSGP